MPGPDYLTWAESRRGSRRSKKSITRRSGRKGNLSPPASMLMAGSSLPSLIIMAPSSYLNRSQVVEVAGGDVEGGEVAGGEVAEGDVV